jgi:hypothetical protein
MESAVHKAISSVNGIAANYVIYTTLEVVISKSDSLKLRLYRLPLIDNQSPFSSLLP